MPDWIIIADELSAAWEAGAAFAAQGWKTRAALLPGVDFDGAQAYALTTESRGLTEGAAAQAVEQALLRLDLDSVPTGYGRLFKPLDLALRGHPRVELDALLRRLRLDRALVVPAFPAQGQSVRETGLWVGDALVESTAASQDLLPQAVLQQLFDLGPGSRSLALADIRRGTTWVMDYLARGGPGIVLAHAETDEDLHILAQAGLMAEVRLFCGSPALAQALAAVLPQPGEDQPARPAALFQAGPVLIVAGSRSAVTQRQVAALREQGVLTLEPGPEDLRVDATVLEWASQLVRTLSSGRPALIGAANLPPRLGNELLVASGLATLALETVNRTAPAGLVLTGGDTAIAVCLALSCRAIDLGGELQPGVVWGRLTEGRCTGLPVILKAGSTGSEQTLVEILGLI